MNVNENENLNAETTATVDPVEGAPKAAPVKRITKRGWIIMAASIGALLVAGGIATPIIASNIAQGNALNALTASEAAIEDAHADLVAAYEGKHLVIGEVPAVYTESGTLVSIARADIIADAATVEQLQVVRQELLEVSGVTVDGENIVIPEAQTAAAPPAATVSSSIEAIKEQTERNDKLAKSLAADVKSAKSETKAVEDKIDEVEEGMETVAASGAEFATGFAGFEKGSAEARAALTASVDVLSGAEGTTLERFQGYVAAFDGLKASHDEVVAAEQAAAEEAARQEAAAKGVPYNGGGSSNRGGSNGGGSNGGSSNGGGSNGGSSNGGGSNGGGSTGGGGSAPAPQPPAPQPQPQPQTPAKFQTGALYVGYSGRCSFYSSHQVGWGGTSTGAGHMDSLGASWSATVNGDTVTYYICD